MTHLEDLANRYPLIVKYCRFSGSFGYYIQAQLEKAARYNCPGDTINVEDGPDDSAAPIIKTIRDIKHPGVACMILGIDF